MVAFSVLIPVFNSEEHLQECVDSVLNQTFQNFEIILIDDGSTDRSGDICEKYSALDKRIEVIRQRNQGPTIARIAAFQRASGRYVIYMDSDDLWDEQLLEKVQKAIEKYISSEMKQYHNYNFLLFFEPFPKAVHPTNHLNPYK